MDGVEWERLDRRAIDDRYAGFGGISYPSGAGVFAPVSDDTGADVIRLYPAPAQAGLTILAITVGNPPTMDTDDDVTVFPDEYDRAILHHAASVTFDTVEDNPEMGEFHRQRFEDLALELKRLRTGRTGRGSRLVRIPGRTA